MPIQTKREVVATLQTRFKVSFAPIRGKMVFFETTALDGRRVVVCSPHSKTHKDGQGWIDLTRIQIELMGKYDAAILALRLPRHQTFFLDFQRLKPLLAEHCMFVNDREGEHWKMYIWPTKLEVRQNSTTLLITPNTFDQIESLFAWGTSGT